MSNGKKDSREDLNFKKNITYRQEKYAKDVLIDRPANQADRIRSGAQGAPAAEGPKSSPGTETINKKEEMLRSEARREANRRRDHRQDFEFDKDVRFQKESYTKDDLIDRPVNQAQRYAIQSQGVMPSEEAPGKEPKK